MARWLAQRGDARALALASRSGVLAQDTAMEWKGLHATSVATLLQRCDTAEGPHVGRLMVRVTRAASAMGVWHAAGVLADGVLLRQTAERLTRVYAPKAHGAVGAALRFFKGCCAHSRPLLVGGGAAWWRWAGQLLCR